MLVSGKVLLEKANKEGYAVGAFNINNMEMAQAIFEAANEASSPIFIQTSEGARKYAGGSMLYSIVKSLSDKYPHIPVALHLDHGSSVESCIQAMRDGYTSVMIDASHYDFEKNVAMTKAVCDIAHAINVNVEAELGRLMGIEDNVNVSEHDSCLVNVDEAEQFVKLTNVDALAPAIGTSHGAFKFKGEPKLDFERLVEVKAKCKIPLVLHGASSIPDYVREAFESSGGDLKGSKGVPFAFITEAIKGGINKVNVDTDLRILFMAHVRKVANESPSEIDPRNFFKSAKEAVTKLIVERMQTLGSAGKI